MMRVRIADADSARQRTLAGALRALRKPHACEGIGLDREDGRTLEWSR